MMYFLTVNILNFNKGIYGMCYAILGIYYRKVGKVTGFEVFVYFGIHFLQIYVNMFYK